MASVRAIAVVGVLALSSIFLVASATPAAAAVTVTVDPSTGLADGQPVTITGEGFAPNASVGAAQCTAAVSTSRNTSDCDLSNSRTVQADSSGTAVIQLRVKRTISTQNGTVDCATAAEPCVIGAADISDLNDLSRSGGMQITFDPNAPPLPPPDVSLTPSEDLVDRQQVAVYATGFVPGEQVIVGECAAEALAEDSCDPNFQFGGGGQADPTGAVAVGITVRRALRVGTERVDCAVAVGTCVVVARALGGPTGSAPLGFDPSVPLPPPPSITVTPADGLGDGQIVHVTGSGFTPEYAINVVECASEASPSFGCASYYPRYVIPGADGTFSTTTKLQRVVQVYTPTGPNPTDVDCAASAGRCVLWAQDYSDDANSVSTPLTFDPNAPPAAPPTIAVSPSEGLTDGQTVQVSADGFPPGSGVFVVQCVAGSTDGSACDLSHLQGPPTDDNGHLETTYAVSRYITIGPPVPVPAPPVTTVPGAAAGAASSPAAAAFFAADANVPQTFDCASAPGACTLSVAFLGGPTIQAASASLTFDANAVPSTATTQVPTSTTNTSGNEGSSTSTTAAAEVQGRVVTRGPLARTGTDVRDGLRLDLVLLIAGSVALVFAATLRARAHRRA